MEFFLHQRPDPHRLQVILRRNLQPRLQPFNLPRIRQLVYLPARNQRLENRRPFRAHHRPGQRPVWKLRQLRFHRLQPDPPDHLHRRIQSGPHFRFRPLQIHRRKTGLQIAELARILRRVIEVLSGRPRIFRIPARNRLQHQPAILRAPAHRPDLIHRPRQRHRAMPAHQAICRTQPRNSTERRRRQYRSRRLRPQRKRHQPRRHRAPRPARRSARPARPVPRIQPRPEQRSIRHPVTRPARQFHHGQLSDQHGPGFIQLRQHRSGLVQHLRRVRLRTPRRNLPCHRQQILCAERHTLQRSTEPLALDLVVHQLRAPNRNLRQRQRQRVVARPECRQPFRERAHQFHTRVLMLLQPSVEV